MSEQEREINQAAYRRLKEFIRQNYPTGRFVAIAGGQIVADAASWDELQASLTRMGHTSPDVLVAQAGMDLDEPVIILATELRP